MVYIYIYISHLRKRKEKQKLLCDICLMFTSKFGRTFILKKKSLVGQGRFFFLGVGGRRGLEPRETGFIEQKVKKQENHGTKVEVTECL